MPVQIIQSKWPVPQSVYDEYRKLSHIYLRENGVGLCYDLINASYPLNSKGAQDTAARYDKAVGNVAKVAGAAFVSIRARTLANYLYNMDYASADAYGWKAVGNNKSAKYINNLISQKDWVTLAHYFAVTLKVPTDGLGRQHVVDSINLELLYNWKKKPSKRGQKKPIYVRQWKTLQSQIQGLATVGTGEERVGLIAGGWLIAAMAMGNVPNKGTVVVAPAWLQGQGKGGYSISEDKNMVSYEITNLYGNMGSLMKNQKYQSNKSTQLIAWERKKMIMDASFKQIWIDTVKSTAFDTGF